METESHDRMLIDVMDRNFDLSRYFAFLHSSTNATTEKSVKIMRWELCIRVARNIINIYAIFSGLLLLLKRKLRSDRQRIEVNISGMSWLAYQPQIVPREMIASKKVIWLFDVPGMRAFINLIRSQDSKRH